MALNYSLRPLSPAHLVEGGIQERNRDGFSRQWPSSREVQDRGDNMDWEDVLPADPFGMDIDMNISSTVTAITGLLESLEYGACGRSEVGVSKGDCSFFAELNFLFSKAMDFHPFSGNKKVDDKIFLADTVDARLCEELGHPFCNGGLNLVSTMDLNENPRKVDKIICEELQPPFGDDGFNFACTTARHEDHQKDDEILMADTIDEAFCDGGFDFACAMDMNEDNHKAIGVASYGDDGEYHPAWSDSDPGNGEPHEALSYALAYLGVRDLLSAERVCKSMRDSVNDALLWKNVHIDQPLNDRITDEILVQLTGRSKGGLECLSLVDCQRITDDGFERILESNPRLTKLSVPGCTKLSIDRIVSALRAFNSVSSPGIKCLRIGAHNDVTQEHLDELMSLMGIRNHAQANRNKPLFCHMGNFYISCEDERPIDIETCPRCQKLKLVYDCPAESCQGKDHATQSCRACRLCIPRCVQCGKCVSNREYVENFCLEFFCSVCWKQLSRCQERQDAQPSPSNHAVTQEPVSSFHG